MIWRRSVKGSVERDVVQAEAQEQELEACVIALHHSHHAGIHIYGLHPPDEDVP